MKKLQKYCPNGSQASGYNSSPTPLQNPLSLQLKSGAGRRGDLQPPGGLMVSNGLEALQPILSRSQVLIVSRAEARQLTGQSEPGEAALALSQVGPQVVILTLGEQDALIRSRGMVQIMSAFTLEKIVDTTAAGDAFAAGMVSGVQIGWDWVKAVLFGCAVASLKTAHFGARGGLPDFQQAEGFFRRKFAADRKPTEVGS